jgi:hypothetical protein
LIAGGLVRVGGSINDAIDPVQPLQVDPEAAPPPVGLDRESYLRPENLRSALARLRGEGRVPVGAHRAGSHDRAARELEAPRRVELPRRPGSPAVSSAPPTTTSTPRSRSRRSTRPRPRAWPGRRRGRHRSSVDDIDYLYIQRNVGGRAGFLYFKDRTHFTADRHGGHVERG